jgi:uncharacterized delta-60 repeat protein
MKIKSILMTFLIFGCYSGLSATDGDYEFIESHGIGALSQDRALDVAIQDDGKIVMAGFNKDNGTTNKKVALMRYNKDGSFDSTFGFYSNGEEVLDYNGDIDEARGVAIGKDQSIIAVGSEIDSKYGDENFLIIRFDRDASEVPYAAKLNFDISGHYDDRANDVAIAQDGSIIVVGESDNGSNDDFAIARYTLDDENLQIHFDSSFGVTGFPIRQAIGSGDDRAKAVTIQNDGKIVVAGITTGEIIPVQGGASVNTTGIGLMRFNTTGTLDMTFGGDGKVATLSTIYNPLYVNDVALTHDGKIIVGGFTLQAEHNADLFLVRYNADGSIDPTFGLNGLVLVGVHAEGVDSADVIQSISVTCNGKIVVAGSANQDSMLMRFEANGSIDTTFANEGIFLQRTGNYSGLYDSVK